MNGASGQSRFKGLSLTRCKRRTACKSVPDPQIADSSKVVLADLTLTARSSLGYDSLHDKIAVSITVKMRA